MPPFILAIDYLSPPAGKYGGIITDFRTKVNEKSALFCALLVLSCGIPTSRDGFFLAEIVWFGGRMNGRT